MKLSAGWKLYESDKRLAGYSKATLASYELQMKLLIRNLGDLDADTVTIIHLKFYLSEQGHLKPLSLGHRIKFIRSFFRWAVDEGLISKNPSVKLKEPKSGSRVPKAISRVDIENLRISCDRDLEYSLVEFLYSTGCRIGEMVQLNLSDINWDNRSVIVLGKGSKEREVYFNIRCGIWLNRYVKSRKDSDPALFVTERSPHRLSIGEARYILKRIASRCGIKTSVYPHKLRHTYATHLLNNGAPLEVIQTLLGHAKLETTRIYAQLSGSRRKELYERYFF